MITGVEPARWTEKRKGVSNGGTVGAHMLFTFCDRGFRRPRSPVRPVVAALPHFTPYPPAPPSAPFLVVALAVLPAIDEACESRGLCSYHVPIGILSYGMISCDPPGVLLSALIHHPQWMSADSSTPGGSQEMIP